LAKPKDLNDVIAESSLKKKEKRLANELIDKLDRLSLTLHQPLLDSKNGNQTP